MNVKLFVITPFASIFFIVHLMNRIVKGLCYTLIDVLIANLFLFKIRGKTCVLRQSLDTVGVLFGSLQTIGLLLLCYNKFQTMFWAPVIKGIIVIALLLFGVHESKQHPYKKHANPIHCNNLSRLSRIYWWVTSIVAVFTLERFSEALLVSHTQQGEIPIACAPIAIMEIVLKTWYQRLPSMVSQ